MFDTNVSISNRLSHLNSAWHCVLHPGFSLLSDESPTRTDRTLEGAPNGSQLLISLSALNSALTYVVLHTTRKVSLRRPRKSNDLVSAETRTPMQYNKIYDHTTILTKRCSMTYTKFDIDHKRNSINKARRQNKSILWRKRRQKTWIKFGPVVCIWDKILNNSW